MEVPQPKYQEGREGREGRERRERRERRRSRGLGAKSTAAGPDPGGRVRRKRRRWWPGGMEASALVSCHLAGPTVRGELLWPSAAPASAGLQGRGLAALSPPSPLTPPIRSSTASDWPVHFLHGAVGAPPPFCPIVLHTHGPQCCSTESLMAWDGGKSFPHWETCLSRHL